MVEGVSLHPLLPVWPYISDFLSRPLHLTYSMATVTPAWQNHWEGSCTAPGTRESTFTSTHICVCKYTCRYLSFWKSITSSHLYSSRGDFWKVIHERKERNIFFLQQEKAIKRQILTIPGSNFF
jgi:hypothetical protein